MKKGETALPGFRYFAVKPKLIHYGGVIFNEAGDACAISENVLVHVDMNTRRSCEMNDETIHHLNEMLNDHTSTGAVDFELRLKI